MNYPIDEPIPAFPDVASEREWLAQEEARRRELLQLDSAADDAQLRPYRAIAHALREPLNASLPADFARRMAAQANAVNATAMDGRFERGLIIALIIAMAAAAAEVTTLYGATWLATAKPLLSLMHVGGGPWLPALLACVGVSWLLGKLPHHHPTSPQG